MKVKHLIKLLEKCYDPEFELNLSTMSGTELVVFEHGVYNDVENRLANLMFEEVRVSSHEDELEEDEIY